MRQNTLLAFIGGALIGAAFAIIFAPDKGSNIRQKIKRMAHEEYDSLRNKLHHNQEYPCGEDSE
jgi:hypothetical protein